MLLLWLVVLVIGAAYLTHRRLAPLQILGIVAAYVLLMGIFSSAPGWLLALIWVVLALKIALVALPQWRRKLFTAPVFRWFQRTLPPMSQTEREAIDAGTVWWDGELFSGRPDWRTLLAYPAPKLTEEEQAFIDGPTEALCAMVSDWQIGQDLDLPPEAWAHIKQHGFFALIIPKEYGGKGFSAYAHSQVAMKLATRSGDLASTVMVPNSLGPAELLLHYGTDEQRNRYLPRLARGEKSLFRPHRAAGRFGRWRHARHRHHLQRPVARRRSDRPAPELGKALHHPRPGRHPAGPGLQSLRPRPSVGRTGGARHQPGPDPHRHARRRDRQTPPAAGRRLHERPQQRQRRVRTAGLPDRWPGHARQGLDDVDELPVGGPLHLTAAWSAPVPPSTPAW